MYKSKCLKKADVDVQTETKMIHIYRENPVSGEVVGIKVEDLSSGEYRNIKATEGVILASGGFSND